MSSRYVWARNDVSQTAIANVDADRALHVPIASGDDFWYWTRGGGYSTLNNGPIYIRYGEGYSISGGGYVIDDSTLAEIPDGTKIMENGGGYKIATLSESGVMYWGVSQTSANKYEHLYKVSYQCYGGTVSFFLTYVHSSGIGQYWRISASGAYTLYGSGAVYELAKGAANGTVSNAAQGTYPPRDNCVLSYIYWPLRSPRSSPRQSRRRARRAPSQQAASPPGTRCTPCWARR